MAGLYIGVDVGTQGAKAVVYDAKTKSVVSRGAYKYDVIKTNVPGRAEQHPSLWIEVNLLLDGDEYLTAQIFLWTCHRFGAIICSCFLYVISWTFASTSSPPNESFH